MRTKSEQLAYAKGLEDAAAEVATHWNDTMQVTNQHGQAMRSAAALRRLAQRARDRAATMPSEDGE